MGDKALALATSIASRDDVQKALLTQKDHAKLNIEIEQIRELTEASFIVIGDSQTTLDAVVDVRTLGAIGVVELNQAVDVAKIQRFFIEQGVWIRPFGKLIYLMPPYISDEQSLTKLCNAIYAAIEQQAY